MYTHGCKCPLNVFQVSVKKLLFMSLPFFYGRKVKKQKLGLHLPFLRLESMCMCVCGDGSCLCTEQTDRGAFSWNHKVVKRSMPWPVTCDCKFLCSCYVFQGSWSLTVYLVEEEESSPLYCWAAEESLPCPGSWCWHGAVLQVLLWWTVPLTTTEQQGWWQPPLTWLWLKENLWSLSKWDPALPSQCFHCISDGGWALLQTNCLQWPAEVNFSCGAVHAQPGTCSDRFALVWNPAAD